MKRIPPLVLAAGWLKREGQLGDILAVPKENLLEITIGSITVEPRDGNKTPNYWTDEDAGTDAPFISSINALGLPNPGYSYYEHHLPSMVRAIKDSGRTARVSIAPHHPNDVTILMELCEGASADVIELNLGCPNCWESGGKQTGILSHSLEASRKALEELRGRQRSREWVLAVKVSPLYPQDILPMTRLFAEFGVREIVACNTTPNAAAFDDRGRNRISKEFGGLGGYAVLRQNVGQVMQYKNALRQLNHASFIKIMGVGGVSSGSSVFQYQCAGADSVGIATAFFDKEDGEIFGDILNDLVESDEYAET